MSGAPRHRDPVVAVLALLVGMVIAGCGAGSLSAGQLRTRATRICSLAQQRTAHIATPTVPSQGARFLTLGIDALSRQLTALARLHAPGDQTGDYRSALSATAKEVAALRSAVNGLKAGNDPVVAIKTLQQQLEPLEVQAATAWTTLGLPACQGR